MVKAYFFILLIFFAPVMSVADDVPKIKHSISLYATALIDASKNPDFLSEFKDREKFEVFATRKKAQKLFAWIKSWHEGNLYMDAKLLQQQCESVVIQRKKATVSCSEEWFYRYLKHVAKGKLEETDEPTHIYYNMEYTLVDTGGVWKIADTKVISERKK